jgi:hypothetical protein
MQQRRTKEDNAAIANTWKQIMEPTLNYCQVCHLFASCALTLIIYQTFASSTLEPPPTVIALLTMIRLIESVLEEVQRRDCPPLESWLFNTRMQFWPVFQKLMSEHVSSLSKLGEASTGGYFKRGSSISDAVVQSVSITHLLDGFLTKKYISADSE